MIIDVNFVGLIIASIMASAVPLILASLIKGVSDLKDKSLLEEKVYKLLNHHNIWLKNQNFETVDPDSIITNLIEISQHVLEFADETWVTLDNYNLEGKSSSKSLQLGLDFSYREFLTLSAAYKNYIIKSNYNSGYLSKPLQPKNIIFYWIHICNS